jgi:hypothetical protein
MLLFIFLLESFRASTKEVCGGALSISRSTRSRNEKALAYHWGSNSHSNYCIEDMSPRYVYLRWPNWEFFVYVSLHSITITWNITEAMSGVVPNFIKMMPWGIDVLAWMSLDNIETSTIFLWLWTIAQRYGPQISNPYRRVGVTIKWKRQLFVWNWSWKHTFSRVVRET